MHVYEFLSVLIVGVTWNVLGTLQVDGIVLSLKGIEKQIN